MLEELKYCPVCSSIEFEQFLKCQDYTVSNEVFEVVRCKSCDFTFTNPRPTEDTISDYYKAEKYISHTDTKEGLINKLYHQVRNITLNQKLKLINSLSKKGSLLDVGCGTGYFLQKSKLDSWKVAGTEPDEQARTMAAGKTSVPILDNIFKIPTDQKYDIITLWHVLEHVHRLKESIDHLKNLLSENGKIIIAVPNKNSLDAQIYKEHWAAYDVPRHLYHFVPETLKNLMEKHQLELLETKGMLFDSFYVSMMSQQYKGEKNIVKSFINGCKSNYYASKHHKNYSSIIYIFKHK